MGYIEDKIEHVAAVVAMESELTRSAVEASTAATVRGLRIDGALPRQLRANAENYSMSGRLVGWSLRAATADVTVTFHDGHDASADIIATTVIKAGASDTVSAPGAGIAFVDALYAEVTTAGGTVAGAVWIGAVD